MCKSMPAKRYLLVTFSLFVVVLSAQVTTWVLGSVYNFRTSASEMLTGYNVNNTTYVQQGRNTVELENRFVYTDGKQADRQEKVYDMINLSAYRSWDNAFAKVFLRTELIGKPYGEIIPPGDFFQYYEKQFRQAGVSGKINYGPVTASFNARYRYFSFSNLPIYAAFTKDIQGDNIRGDLELAYDVYKPVSVIVTAYDKSALGDKLEEYDLSSVGTGLRLYLPITNMQHLTGQTSVEWRRSDILEAEGNERLIPIYHNLRYSRMILSDVAGFVNYENRSFYDRESQSFLFNSQFVRASCKYTLPYDQSLGSFVEIGGKYAPQDLDWHKSSNLMGKTEMRVIDRLYLGGGINLMPKRLNRYEALARYFITPVNEVFLDYMYTDDEEFDKFSAYLAAGVRLLF